MGDASPPPALALRPIISTLRGETGFIYTARARELAKRGFSVINFGVGQPDLPTFSHIVEAAKRALDQGFTGYTEAAGIPELREAVAEYLNERYGSDVRPDEVVATPGAKAAIFMALAAYLQPGDEVIVPEPSFYAYPEVARLLGAKPVYVPLKWLGSEGGFELDVEAIERAITKRTKIIVVNNPHNPTGAVFSPKTVERLFELARERKILIMADEVYDNFIYEGEFKSLISFEGWRDYLLYVNGLSKTFSMTGWRLGYLVVRREVASVLTKLAVNVWTCPTSFVQKAGALALKGPWEPVKDMIRLFRRRRDVMVSKLREIGGLEVWPSRGAFYVFPRAHGLLKSLGMTAEEFADKLLELKHVAVLPGTVFPETAGVGHLRLSFALDETKIAEGVERIKAFVEEAQRVGGATP